MHEAATLPRAQPTEPATTPSSTPALDKRLRPFPIAWFAGMHLACFLAIWTGVSATAVIVAVALYYLRMFALSAGFHRLLAHRSYEATAAFRAAIAFLGTTAMQKGPLWWASVHRHHHRTSDTPEDAHSPVAHGFWWSHMGWILSPAHTDTDLSRVPDLVKHRSLRWLDSHPWAPPLLLAGLVYGLGAWLGAAFPHLNTSGPQLLVWGVVISTVALYHGTWTVNSVVHLWGTRPYRTNDFSRNNGLVALWTCGEGWHNNHHRFPASERQGFRWWQFDLSHMALKVCSWFGLVRKLRAPTAAILEEGYKR